MQRNMQSGLLIAAMAVAIIGSAGCDKLKARDKLNKGVQAYKAAQFDEAVEDFKEAKALDPKLMNARLYLATAYASQFIPGAPSQDNINMGKQAIAEFQDVLSVDPNNLSAIDGIGSLLYSMGGNPYDEKTLEESKQYHLKHIQLQPQDPEPYYWVAVIDWAVSFHGDRGMREDYNKKTKKPIKDTDPMPPQLAKDYAEKFGSLIDEGVDYAKKAMDRKPQYDDAMAYLNLLYRNKADTETSVEARDNDVKMADDLVHKVQIIKQQRMANPTPTPSGTS
jgi:tetratricopeptide (TPR) repeat protein